MIIEIKNFKSIKPLDLYWKECIGGGQAVLLMRQSTKNHLKDCVNQCGFKSVRMHDIFGDPMFVYREDVTKKAIYNWQYIDDVYDTLIEIGIKPHVSFNFMPSDLAKQKDLTLGHAGFNASPPKDHKAWKKLLVNAVRHFIERYGLKEVKTWYFESWNEPDLMFGNPFDTGYWGGSIEDFYKLYATMATALKEIEPSFKVGGPAVSCFNDYEEPGKMKPPYMESFLEYCAHNKVPLDYVSVHPYPTNFPNDQVNCDSMSIKHKWREKNALYNDAVYMRELIDGSSFPNAEIHLNEWNISPSHADPIRDSVFMAPFIIKNMLECQNLVSSLAFWMFTDIFEEAAKEPSVFCGGYGLVNTQGLRKPSFHAYRFLDMLGSKIIQQGEDYIVTIKNSGSIQILIWNHVYFKDPSMVDGVPASKESKKFEVKINDVTCFKFILVYSLDHENGAVKEVWEKLGAPETPNREEVKILQKLAEPKLEVKKIDQASFDETFFVPTHGVKFFEFIVK